MTPEIEVFEDCTNELMAGSDPNWAVNGGDVTPPPGSGDQSTEDEDDNRAKGGYTAWGANWDYDEF